jgi:hypothetical protein
MKHLLGLVALSLLSLHLNATAAPQGTDDASAVQAADPASFADDICWVAPEWRE